MKNVMDEKSTYQPFLVPQLYAVKMYPEMCGARRLFHHLKVQMGYIFVFPNVFLCLIFFSAPQLIHQGKIDYLVFDYLSEITMSLMTAAKNKFPVCVYFI